MFLIYYSMTKIIIAIITSVILISGTLGFVLGNPNAFAENEKVNICHFPPGNPENAQNIMVSINAVPSHIEEHGDFVGTCEGGPDCRNFPDQPACEGPTCAERCKLGALKVYETCIATGEDQARCELARDAFLKTCLATCEPPRGEDNLVACACPSSVTYTCTTTSCDDQGGIQSLCVNVCGDINSKPISCIPNAEQCVITK